MNLNKINFKKALQSLSSKYNLATIKSEDSSVIDFLKKINTHEISYLEVGSGLGRFVEVTNSLGNFNITCLEINPDLAQRTLSMGYKTVNVNILENTFKDEQFDIVHCSHVIEHLAYPGVIKALDELIRVTKTGGHIILRSPLMSPDFFTSIDHIRPYPPKAILDFYNNPQQQVTGKFKIELVKEKFRREAVAFFPYSSNIFVSAVNLLMKTLWLLFRFPSSKPNGYVLFLKKL